MLCVCRNTDLENLSSILTCVEQHISVLILSCFTSFGMRQQFEKSKALDRSPCQSSSTSACSGLPRGTKMIVGSTLNSGTDTSC